MRRFGLLLIATAVLALAVEFFPNLAATQTQEAALPPSLEEVKREAGEAFEELAGEEAKLWQQNQAEFRLWAQGELGKFSIEIIDEHVDVGKAQIVLKIVRDYVNELIADNRADATAKRLQLRAFMLVARRKLGLIPNHADREEKARARVIPVPDTAAVAAIQEFSLQDLAKTRQEANWEENIKKEQKRKWWKGAAVTWTSADNKVVFAVGRAVMGRDESLARDKAMLEARAKLTKEGPGLHIREITGSSAVAFKYIKDKGANVVYTLLAIPAVLLSD